MENKCLFTTDGRLILVNKLEGYKATGSAILLRPMSKDDEYRGYMYYPTYTVSTKELKEARPVNPDYLFKMAKILDINWKVCFNIVNSGKLSDTGIHTLELFSNSLCFGTRYYISPEESLLIQNLGDASMLIEPKYLDEASCVKLYNQIYSTQTLLYNIVQKIAKLAIKLNGSP